jgi:hypothetical protein
MTTSSIFYFSGGAVPVLVVVVIIGLSFAGRRQRWLEDDWIALE